MKKKEDNEVKELFICECSDIEHQIIMSYDLFGRRDPVETFIDALGRGRRGAFTSVCQGSRKDQKHQVHGYGLQSIYWPSVC